MKGPTLGWLKSASSASFMSLRAPWPGGRVMPSKRVLAPVSCHISQGRSGSSQFSLAGSNTPGLLVSLPAKFQPVNAAASAFTTDSS